MKSAIETITPEMAARILAANRGNRPIRQQWVESLAEQMKSGNWAVSHQGIALGADGRLLDGQHRLSAIVLAGVPIRMVISTEVDDAAFKVIDCGIKRLAHDRISLLDGQSANRRACVLINHYCRYVLRLGSGQMPVSTIESEFARYPDAWTWAANFFCVYQPVYYRAGVITAMAIYHTIDRAGADVFARGYRTGEGLAYGSPVLLLRRAVENWSRDCSEDYWRASSATRAHFHGEPLTRNLYPASEDMVGNSNSARVIRERHEKALKAQATRAAKMNGNNHV